MFNNKTSKSMLDKTKSPFAIDYQVGTLSQERLTIFFDGVFKGTYSLAIVNRYLARALFRHGHRVRLYTPENDWRSDQFLSEMQDVHSMIIDDYPNPFDFDIHIRNTWPPRADDMVGRRINAYVCFAWEEPLAPKDMIMHFNSYLNLVMVTSNFVKESLLNSGLKIPVAVVGNGTEHLSDGITFMRNKSLTNEPKKILHVSSCFPRKGADILVEAFSETFSIEDNVELIIKTFDNPHNTIDQVVAKTKNIWPRSAPIHIIKKDFSHLEMANLYQSSDLFVLATRGEGFGLPLAEALLNEVPVVTTGYSGHTDFCTTDTAWLVDYKLVPSTAHVSSIEGLWADPDRSSLSAQMRNALFDLKSSSKKVAAGKKMLSTHFKWSDVARRVTQSLNNVLQCSPDTTVDEPLKIDLVSTWQQICGIATYSESLFNSSALRPLLNKVYARVTRYDKLPNALTDPHFVTRPWGYDASGILQLQASIKAGQGDIIWFQHHPGFFSNRDMNDLVIALDNSAYRLKVITLHNVRDTIKQTNLDWLRHFEIIVVHTEDDAVLLSYLKVNTVVIPHGIQNYKLEEKTDPGIFKVGTFGFLYSHKNISLLIKSISRAREFDSRFRLLLLNCVRASTDSMKERVRVESLIDIMGLSDYVETDFSFLQEKDIVQKLSSCDVICFPYGDSNESATGAARIALAANRPIICSRSNVLEDLSSLSFRLNRLDADTLAEAFLVLLASPHLRGFHNEKRQHFVERSNYETVGLTHAKLFRKFIKGRT